MLMGSRSAVKMRRAHLPLRSGRRRGAAKLNGPWPGMRSRRIVFVFRGPIGGEGIAAADADAVKRQALTVSGHRRAFRAERARVDAHPGNLRRQSAIFDFRT